MWKISSMNEKIETVKRYNLTLSDSYKYYMNDLSFKNNLYAGLGYGTGYLYNLGFCISRIFNNQSCIFNTQSCSKNNRYDNPMLS